MTLELHTSNAKIKADVARKCKLAIPVTLARFATRNSEFTPVPTADALYELEEHYFISKLKT